MQIRFRYLRAKNMNFCMHNCARTWAWCPYVQSWLKVAVFCWALKKYPWANYPVFSVLKRWNRLKHRGLMGLYFEFFPEVYLLQKYVISFKFFCISFFRKLRWISKLQKSIKRRIFSCFGERIFLRKKSFAKMWNDLVPKIQPKNTLSGFFSSRGHKRKIDHLSTMSKLREQFSK